MQVTAINKEVESGVSKNWLKDAYHIYIKAKGPFSLFAIISTIIGAIPLIGAFMLPIFTYKYAEMASKIENEEEISLMKFFLGMFSRKSIVIIGIFHVIVYALALAIKYFTTKSSTMTNITGEIMELTLSFIAIIVIFIFILAFWLSPIICLKNDDIKALPALILSFKVFFKYFGKIIMYGFIVMIIGAIVIAVLVAIAAMFQHMGYAIFAAIPGILGVVFILVWMPVLHLSAYFIYKDLFLTYNE